MRSCSRGCLAGRGDLADLMPNPIHGQPAPQSQARPHRPGAAAEDRGRHQLQLRGDDSVAIKGRGWIPRSWLWLEDGRGEHHLKRHARTGSSACSRFIGPLASGLERERTYPLVAKTFRFQRKPATWPCRAKCLLTCPGHWQMGPIRPFPRTPRPFFMPVSYGFFYAGSPSAAVQVLVVRRLFLSLSN